jgi:hypothetical protein
MVAFLTSLIIFGKMGSSSVDQINGAHGDQIDGATAVVAMGHIYALMDEVHRRTASWPPSAA